GTQDDLEFACTGLSGNWKVLGSINVNDGKWHHVAGVYDGSEISLYVDGILDDSLAASGTIATTAHHVWLGGNVERPGREWNGLLDDVRIYDHALSAAEIVGLTGKMGTGYTYQGRLLEGNNPADGSYDFEFKLYSDPGIGLQEGSTIDINDLDVIDGYFTVELDFGSDVFSGDGLWLDISVRPGNSTGGFTNLSPRQAITPVPYALNTRGILVDNSNTFLGIDAGTSNTTGDWNTFLGHESGYSNTAGYSNTFVGRRAGYFNTSNQNTFVGDLAGAANTTGWQNTFVGEHAGGNHTTGFRNTFLGNYAGYLNTTGTGNVFLGREAGFNETGSNKLYIANSSADPPLIYGDFSTGNVGIGTTIPGGKLDVQGGSDAAIYAQSSGSNAISATSSAGGGFAAVFADATTANTYGVWGSSSYVAGHFESTSGTALEASTTSGIAATFMGGNVGIGTMNPNDKLDVNGNINTNSVYKIGGETVLANPGTYDIYVGVDAGASKTNYGYKNTFLGYRAGYSNIGDGGDPGLGSYNTFLGYSAGHSNTTGFDNTFLGHLAGFENTEGNSNTFLGNSAGLYNTTGSYNTFLGVGAGHDNTEGGNNTFLGYGAGRLNITGHYNTFVGELAGINNLAGSRNVFIGNKAGHNETGSNKLYIANGKNDSNVLIYGDFSTGHVGIGTTDPSVELHIASSDSTTSLRLENLQATSKWDIASNTTGHISIYEDMGSGASNRFRIAPGGDTQLVPNGGKVGIGTYSPAYDLDVDGDIRAIGSVFYGGTDGNADGTAYPKSDYVFEEGYGVMSIDQVETYLKKENHLPWMTSTKQEKEENGNVIDMTRMAFETVETAENIQIQVIELNKLIKEQAEFIKTQQKRITAFEKAVAKNELLKEQIKAQNLTLNQRLDALEKMIRQNQLAGR
ncbi:MAG: LamG-like jellyroll fold domain-containing protein, partial [Planctomycetota bacterium]